MLLTSSLSLLAAINNQLPNSLEEESNTVTSVLLFVLRNESDQNKP